MDTQGYYRNIYQFIQAMVTYVKELPIGWIYKLKNVKPYDDNDNYNDKDYIVIGVVDSTSIKVTNKGQRMSDK